MNSQPRLPPAAENSVRKMEIRIHVYPDARATAMRRYCSAWARRYARVIRA